MTDTATTTAAPTASPAASSAPSNGKTTLSDTFRDAFSGDAPLTEKLKNVYKAKPAAVIALGAVAGLAILNSFRGK